MAKYILNRSKQKKVFTGPLLLIIMDGVGLGKKNEANAVHMANTPTIDALCTTSPLYTQLKAHGKAVGMPSDEDMGNSEVGHNALGAGRVFDQGASLVEREINDGSLFQGTTWKNSLENTKTHNSRLHFIGLLSDGNVHSHIRHLLKMLDEADQKNVTTVRCHILLDGRDVYERSALSYIQTLEEKLALINSNRNRDYKIASGGGRMITTMDRYNADWSIVERGWHAHVLGKADRTFTSAQKAIETFYAEDSRIIDQYLPPFVITENNIPVGTIEDNDSVILSNFRGDRALEISMAFEMGNSFNHFDRVRTPNVHFAGMMQYDGDLKIPQNFLVMPPHIDGSISHYLCDSNVRSFAISETQKYGHVTYFWNGNYSGYINKNLESFQEVPSDTLPFDQKPEMKAYESTAATITAIESGQYDFLRINIANGDMVGHTGVMKAAVKAVEVTDDCVNQLLSAIEKANGAAVILADHGNADIMFTQKDGIKKSHTAHTLNPVPCAIVGNALNKHFKMASVAEPGLANVAATLCNLLGYDAPTDYEPSLIQPI
jgi:2,3-bisphosphoglycerate-independent phosphoglycerate mutase